MISASRNLQRMLAIGLMVNVETILSLEKRILGYCEVSTGLLYDSNVFSSYDCQHFPRLIVLDNLKHLLFLSVTFLSKNSESQNQSQCSKSNVSLCSIQSKRNGKN